ncbi:MAG TPA: RelA/SpoT family protein [Cyclobacteriaceae bacterium]|nr:RelA/SpoT family protein [Cyclobacteriaceae bacterium]
MIITEAEVERQEIIRRYRRLLRHAKPFLKAGDARQIKKAFFMSLEAHRGMRRHSGDPYIYHPLEVARIAVDEIGLGTTSIIAALLHDVVEDTEFEITDIEKEFGPKVAKIIDGLTKISGVFDYGTSQQAENFRKMLLTLSEDVRVILIKLADRLHNMRTLDSLPRNKQLRIASETIYLYAPLAHRLGLNAIKTELEDLYLKYSDSEVFNEISEKMKANKPVRDRFIKKFIAPIQVELGKLEFDYDIKGRPKSIYSVWNKMKQQNIPFEEVYDLFAIRITLDVPFEKEKAACWQVYSIVTDFYKPNPDRLRDWISTPKANGYESLHTTVMSKTGLWVEVQIRTLRMDEIAEKGYAAHWKYKDTYKGSVESGLEEWIRKVRDMLENNDISAIEFIDDFRSNLFSEEVFVFTPKGDLRILPNGATALDFAFDIHSEIGGHCIGAKVNQKLVPLNYVLKNGDQVEILTSSKQKPNEDWLRFVASSKAKSKIKDLLKVERKLHIAQGKEVVIRKLKQLKITPSEEVFNQIRAYFDAKTNNELFIKIANEDIDHTEIKKFQDARTRQKAESLNNVQDAQSFAKQISGTKGEVRDMLLIGEDMDVIDYTYAKCCNPIPGDDVFGFVTVNEGIKVHRTTCPNAIELMSRHGHRVIKAKWTSQKNVAFLAGVKIIGTDRMGLINDVTMLISNELKVNMKNVSIDTESGIFEGVIMLYVNDTLHLEILINKLRKINGIVKVTRFDAKDEV